MSTRHKTYTLISSPIWVSTLLFLLYTLIYLIFLPQLGTMIGILVTIPVLIITWQYGIRYAMVGWLVGILLNVGLRTLVGYRWQSFLIDGSSLGSLILFLVTLAVAYMRQTSLHLKQSEAELKALYNATSRLFHANDVLSLGEQIAQTVAQEFEQIDCGILLCTPQSTQIRRLARTRTGDISPEQPLNLDGKGLVPHAIRSGQVIYVPDVHQDSRYVANVATTRSELVIPLRTATTVIGALDLQSPDVDAFNEATRRMLSAYAERAAAAIGTQLLNDELQSYVGELEWRVLQRTAELQSTKEKIEAILNNSNDTILLISPEGIIQHVNPAFANLCGYDPAEALGQSVHILYPSREACDLREAVDQIKLDNQVLRLDTHIKRANGDLLDVDVMISAMEDDAGQITGIIWNIRDITDRKRAIEAVRQSQAQLQAIMDHTQSLIYVKDTDGRYLLVNRQFEKGFGVSCEEIRGKVDTDLFPEGIAAIFQKNDQLVLKDKVPHAFEEHVIKDGQTHTYISNKFPLFDAGGKVYGVCGISTDITTQKQIEASLRSALEKEQELSKLKTGFTSMVSHEFRTPLAVISSSTDILLHYYTRLSDEKREEKLQQIQLQIGRLTHLMTDVLTVSQADTIGLTFEPEETHMLQLCQTIIEEVSLAYQHDVHIDFIHRNIEGIYWLDQHLLRHIFQNLLSNALKYSKAHTTVSVDISQSDSNLILVVSDQGIGMPEAYQENLFKSFSRASNVGTIQGNGLGLAIVKRAVDAHQGHIQFTSTEGKGTRFKVTLPVEKLVDEHMPRPEINIEKESMNS